MFKTSNSCLAPIFGAMGVAVALALAVPQPAAAASPFASFTGSWSGSGQVIGAKGDHEQIRCRAQYSKAEHAEALNQKIVCASDSYRIDITSYLEASGTMVQGSWQEATRNISGHLTGRIEAGQFSGDVVGPSFSAAVSLSSKGRTQVVSIRPHGGDIADVRVDLERRE